MGIGPEVFPGEPGYDTPSVYSSSVGSLSGSVGSSTSGSGTFCNQACPDVYDRPCLRN
ncbi:hypothetical protein PR003_g31668 [Phytophthora rubi]|uniref:Uncharacterized protein n=1 Tax=Phytophthora rubi TaxID=129364 RepID=A0A6A4B483_9STRA|nr:hypothetical protein PR002_g30473 [Phytophthora rubi]KAE8959721.1 hypothetical protein PR001_g30623 [Phytophthora rubi]KAE9267758.1 hypothetical protein PR003_g31668 [Phytophthora rubi]